MTQLNFNLDMDKLTEEILGSDLNATTKGLAVAVFNAYMEAERDAYVQAKNRERSPDRQDMRVQFIYASGCSAKYWLWSVHSPSSIYVTITGTENANHQPTVCWSIIK